MKLIPLSRGYFTKVDDEDFVKFASFRWFIAIDKYGVRAIRNGPTKNGKKKRILLSREILNAPMNLIVDHKNHDTLDNRKSNLRLCTRQQNSYNMIKRKGYSKYKGVTFNPKCTVHPWIVSIRKNGKRLYLGCYSNEKEAGEVYKIAAEKYQGDFALHKSLEI